jgi:hypothetical protein
MGDDDASDITLPRPSPLFSFLVLGSFFFFCVFDCYASCVLMLLTGGERAWMEDFRFRPPLFKILFFFSFLSFS